MSDKPTTPSPTTKTEPDKGADPSVASGTTPNTQKTTEEIPAPAETAPEPTSSSSDSKTPDAKPTESGNSTPADKPKKKFRLPFFSKKAKEPAAPVETKADSPVTPITPQDVVKSFDPSFEAEPTPEELASQLDAQIKESGDYLEFKIPVNRAVALSSMVVILLALIPMGLAIKTSLSQDNLSLTSFGREPKEVEVEVVDEHEPVRIRVKHYDSDEEMIKGLVVKLEGLEADMVDLTPLEDPLTDQKGVVVVDNPKNTQLSQAIFQLLSADYPTSTGSASLTEDSDFDAVILVTGLNPE